MLSQGCPCDIYDVSLSLGCLNSVSSTVLGFCACTKPVCDNKMPFKTRELSWVVPRPVLRTYKSSWATMYDRGLSRYLVQNNGDYSEILLHQTGDRLHLSQGNGRQVEDKFKTSKDKQMPVLRQPKDTSIARTCVTCRICLKSNLNLSQLWRD